MKDDLNLIPLDISYREKLFEFVVSNHLSVSKSNSIYISQEKDVEQDFKKLSSEEFNKYHYFGLFHKNDLYKEHLIGSFGICIHLDKNNYNKAELTSISVNKNYRKKGIGSYLIEMAIKKAKYELSLKLLNLIVVDMSEDAVKLYDKFGFTRKETNFIIVEDGTNRRVTEEDYNKKEESNRFRVYEYELEL
jgi:ribosomal protein S18 acetylase RimI-like enzyme